MLGKNLWVSVWMIENHPTKTQKTMGKNINHKHSSKSPLNKHFFIKSRNPVQTQAETPQDHQRLPESVAAPSRTSTRSPWPLRLVHCQARVMKPSSFCLFIKFVVSQVQVYFVVYLQGKALEEVFQNEENMQQHDFMHLWKACRLESRICSTWNVFSD